MWERGGSEEDNEREWTDMEKGRRNTNEEMFGSQEKSWEQRKTSNCQGSGCRMGKETKRNVNGVSRV